MSSSIRHSEVSEVARVQIQRTESGWRACARTMYMVMYTSMYMGMYNVHDARAVEGRNGRKIDSKVPTSKYLDALKASKAFSTNNLAKQGHNLAFLSHNLAVTSPTKPMKTLVFSQKARLARLKVDIPRVRENYVHPHVHVHSLYRSGLEITSLDLANLASGFLSVRARLFCFHPSHDVAPVVSSLTRRPPRRISHTTRPWPNRAPLWQSASLAPITSAHRIVMGPSPPLNPSWGAWEKSRY